MIAPWAVVLVSALWAVWYWATTPRSTPENVVFPDPTAPWEFVFLFSLYGVPTAYLSLVLFLPLYYLLRSLNLISYWTIIAVGLLVCIPAALFYGRSSYEFPRILVFLLPYGAAVSACFLRITKRTPNQVAEIGRKAASRMPPLFSSRAGISVVGGGAFRRASWPLGKVTLDVEALTVDVLFKSYRLRVTDIDRVRRRLFTVDVERYSFVWSLTRDNPATSLGSRGE